MFRDRTECLYCLWFLPISKWIKLFPHVYEIDSKHWQSKTSLSECKIKSLILLWSTLSFRTNAHLAMIAAFKMVGISAKCHKTLHFGSFSDFSGWKLFNSETTVFSTQQRLSGFMFRNYQVLLFTFLRHFCVLHCKYLLLLTLSPLEKTKLIEVIEELLELDFYLVIIPIHSIVYQLCILYGSCSRIISLLFIFSHTHSFL